MEVTMARRGKRPTKAQFKEASKASILKKTARKFGKARAAKQLVAIAFSKARRGKKRR
jgi:hypothetical protein